MGASGGDEVDGYPLTAVVGLDELRLALALNEV